MLFIKSRYISTKYSRLFIIKSLIFAICNRAKFVSLENDIDTTNPMGMLLFTMCAAFAEMERILITERVKAGLIAAHKKGRRGGRPKSLTPEKLKKLKLLIKSNNFSVTEMCTMTEITRSVYYRAINK